MENLNENIAKHYFKPGLYEDILRRLQEQGIDPAHVTRKDIAGVDEFHVRGKAVSKELAESINLSGSNLLDIGCGLGGPCRMLADEYGCMATGIDLSDEYIRTAEKLSALINLSDRTKFILGDAAELPFANDSFDVVWTQHVQMNIPDKKKLYTGIHRVLKPGGYFIYYDVFEKGEGAINFPVPWASSAGLSFLFTSDEIKQILQELGFASQQLTDQTKAGIEFTEDLIIKMQSAPPKLGLNVLMGESTQTKISNLLSGLKQGNLELQSGIYQK